MLSCRCVEAEQLSQYFQRLRKSPASQEEVDLRHTIVKLMNDLASFIPSEDMFLLIDDPNLPTEGSNGARNLIYIAGIGPKVEPLLGFKTISKQGLVGETYALNKSQLIKGSSSQPAVMDKIHLPNACKSALTYPITLGKTAVGVLGLMNKKDPMGFTLRDHKLVEIVGGFLGMSFQSAIDSKKNKEMTKRDHLTGLYNDRYFHEKLLKDIQEAHQNSSPLMLLFMDLDHFKSINDQHGHLVGSQTLKEVGIIMRESIPIPQATLARYGGDEFCAIVPGISLDQAIVVAGNTREKIHQKMFMIENSDLEGSFINFKGVLSASIGLASLHDHIPNIEDIKKRKNLFLQAADEAMYRAKELGKNQVFVASPVTLS
ncbi:MAG: GGDEF domain-containing protein [Bdellovibrionales bacterium]|nr:GGDEF domain-containing protein [Bdellovibrionales bacterium]